MNRKICNLCKRNRRSDKFYPSRGGLRHICKDCEKIKHKKWRLKNVERVRSVTDKWRRDQYIKLGYDQMIIEQCGLCAICEDQMIGNRSAVIDHDHSCCSGMRPCKNCIRGILCSNCNTGIGLFREDTERLRKASEYIKRFTAIKREDC